MNENSRKILEKLISCYIAIHREWFSRSPSPYTAIAFDWYYPEWGVSHKINLAVSLAKVNGHNELEFLPDPYQLEIALEEMPASKAKGASEPIGLIPKTFTYDEEKQAIIERNLSDFLVALLYDEVLKSDEKVVIFQGPFSPKLLGRLGYRHFSHDITFAALTFKNEWFPLEVPEENRALNEDLGNRFFINIEKSTDSRNATFYQLADNKISNGLEEVLKSWVAADRKKNKTIFILEVFCQFPWAVEHPNGRIKSPWITKIKTVQERLKFPGMIFEQGEPGFLPFALACAYDICMRHTRRPLKELELIWRGHWEYLRFYEEDVREMYQEEWEPIEVVARRSLLYLAMFKSEIYNSFRTKIGLDSATNEVHRGRNLSTKIRHDRLSGKWEISRWRELI